MNIEKDITYICNYIEYVFFGIEELQNESYVMNLAKMIKNNMTGSDFSSGKFDFYINNFVAQQLRGIKSNSYCKFQDVKNHVYLAINYYKVYHGVNVENYEHVLCEIMRSICSKYSYDDIIDGKVDNEIEKLIEYSCIKRENDVRNSEHVYQYVLRFLESNKMMFTYNDSLNNLSLLICDYLAKIDAKEEDVLSYEYDSLIYSIIRDRKFGINYSGNFIKIHNAVFKYVSSNNTYMDTSDKSKKIFEEVFTLSLHLAKYGFSENDIITGKCDDIMEKHLRMDCIKVNSKICAVDGREKHNPNKFLLSLNKTYSPIQTKALVLAIISVIGFGVKFGLDNNINDVNYELIDEYDYPLIPYETSNEYVLTLEHIMDQYMENASIDPIYGQICLYKAFESVDFNKYNAMDSMLRLIAEKAKYDDSIFTLYEDIKDCETYVDYMYKNICEYMPEKVTDEMTRAVVIYNSQFANYKELNPYDLLDNKDSSEIDKLSKIYGRYINDLEEQIKVDLRSEGYGRN